MVDAAYQRWLADEQSGQVSLLLAADNATVAGLNTRARAERVAAGKVEADGIRLHDATIAGVGDLIVTRRNDRSLLVHAGRDFVKNGDLWRVEERHDDGALLVRHTRHHGQVRLPARYVQTHVELGYATTTHRAQGMTVETAHLVAGESLTRELLYVGMTRGVRANTAYVIIEATVDPGLDQAPAEPATTRDVLQTILRRVGAEQAATETLRAADASEQGLRTLVQRYEHARSVVVQMPPSQPPETDRVEADTGSEPSRTRLIAGLLTPADVALDTDLARYLDELAHLINARALELAEQALRDQPAWVRALGPAPVRPLHRLRYAKAVATVAAYREIYRITDLNAIEAGRPGASHQAKAWSHAQRAILYARRVSQSERPRKPLRSASPTRPADRALLR